MVESYCTGIQLPFSHLYPQIGVQEARCMLVDQWCSLNSIVQSSIPPLPYGYPAALEGRSNIRVEGRTLYNSFQQLRMVSCHRDLLTIVRLMQWSASVT
jgi:hypothetical protein